MLVPGLPNSRMKDYFDIWTLCRTMDFDGTVLAGAVSETIKRRQTALTCQRWSRSCTSS
jgi:hypothetical protein